MKRIIVAHPGTSLLSDQGAKKSGCSLVTPPPKAALQHLCIHCATIRPDVASERRCFVCCAGSPWSFQAWLQLTCKLLSRPAPCRQLTLLPSPRWRAPSTPPSGEVATGGWRKASSAAQGAWHTDPAGCDTGQHCALCKEHEDSGHASWALFRMLLLTHTRRKSPGLCHLSLSMQQARRWLAGTPRGTTSQGGGRTCGTWCRQWGRRCWRWWAMSGTPATGTTATTPWSPSPPSTPSPAATWALSTSGSTRCAPAGLGPVCRQRQTDGVPSGN